jgi:hypothetical protein
MVEGPLPPDWKLDDDDLKPPAFAPGSVRDEDWRERDIEAAKVSVRERVGHRAW